MTHVAPIPDKPPFMYGLTAFQTALSDILLCVIVERARVVTTGCAPRSNETRISWLSAAERSGSYYRTFRGKRTSQRMYYG